MVPAAIGELRRFELAIEHVVLFLVRVEGPDASVGFDLFDRKVTVRKDTVAQYLIR